ncbi:Ribosomal RNA small subunit methyltransferase E [Microbacterium esteraromaticum]|uniref:Ribosomal RNA small subunit methyltransferase E n=1 Tax=Microbacterium esteraromaticum TaxID=57043 RepID=A0A1R4KIM5_9MICO|nr:16S rRNA (uracil(1498)-N(3))-methyltransferase [Microbacterium esteraromaticum]SJN44211.1 Ribosomal RNA small subunit methyltransferase E [Microbacterium esteraromaticum]
MALHFIVPTCSDAHEGELITLTGAEAKHASVVRRVRVGEAITIGDGSGIWLEAVVDDVSAAQVRVRVLKRVVADAPGSRIVLAQALAKGDRDEMAVQAACELGVDEIVPWRAARSVSRWEGPKAAKGRERWATIVREAAKQAHRAWVPAVAEAQSTAELVARASEQRMLVLDPTAEMPLTTIRPDERDIMLVVGPEGGISPEELTRFADAGAERVRLGDTVLRTSTAGPAAIAVLSSMLDRW